MTKETTSMDKQIDEILYDVVALNMVTDMTQLLKDPDSDSEVLKAKQAILSLINEARKEGYIQGGIDEILRHEKATKKVLEELTHE